MRKVIIDLTLCKPKEVQREVVFNKKREKNKRNADASDEVAATVKVNDS